MTMGKRLFIAVILGFMLGFVLRYSLDHNGNAFMTINTILSLLSGAYMAFLQMLVVPLILLSIIHSMLHFRNAAESRALWRVSLRAIFFLLIMTSIASGLAMLLAMYWHVGEGLSWQNISYQPKHTYENFVDNMLGLLPSNPWQAMSDQNTIAIAIFAIIVGVSALLLHKTEADVVEQFHRVIASFFAIVKMMTRLIIKLTPYGVFALMALLVLENGSATISALLKYFIVIFVVMFSMIILHTVINWFINGYSPLRYFKLAYTALLVAFTTRSSFGTLPVTEEILARNFKVDQLTASFVPSIGATLGMNACAGIFPGMVIAMTMMTLGQPITAVVIGKVMLVTTIASLGVSGIPGTAFVAASAALNLLGLPYFMLGVVQSVDPIVDMGRTATNVNSAITAALFANQARKAEKNALA